MLGADLPLRRPLLAVKIYTTEYADAHRIRVHVEFWWAVLP